MKINSREVIFNFDLPDYDREDIQVKLYKNSLIIRAERKEKNKIKKQDFFHAEKMHKKFKYATTLPEVNPDKAKIQFTKGKLIIVAPRI